MNIFLCFFCLLLFQKIGDRLQMPRHIMILPTKREILLPDRMIMRHILPKHFFFFFTDMEPQPHLPDAVKKQYDRKKCADKNKNPSHRPYPFRKNIEDSAAGQRGSQNKLDQRFQMDVLHRMPPEIYTQRQDKKMRDRHKTVIYQQNSCCLIMIQRV